MDAVQVEKSNLNRDTVKKNSIVEINEKKNKNIVYRFLKRTFDLIVGIIGCMFIVILAIIIKIANVCTGDFASIFYTQKRIGRNGKKFKMYKFRTMIPDADKKLSKMMVNSKELKEEYNENKKLEKDPRITKVGNILRKTSIDEIPQFINVLKGDMSVIGNRPYILREKKQMKEYYKDIILTKPGITGMWQTSGRSNIDFNERLKIEAEYSKKCSLWMDTKIFFKTFVSVLKKEGAK